MSGGLFVAGSIRSMLGCILPVMLSRMYIGRVTEIVPASEATLSRSLASSIGDQAPVDQNKRVVVFVVADIDETVMGFGSLTLAAPDNYDSAIGAEITGVYVHPTVAQQGIGTRIYTELEQRARANEIHSIGLSASLNAVSFYKMHGFEQVQEHTHEFSSHENTRVTGIVVEMKNEL